MPSPLPASERFVQVVGVHFIIHILTISCCAGVVGASGLTHCRTHHCISPLRKTDERCHGCRRKAGYFHARVRQCAVAIVVVTIAIEPGSSLVLPTSIFDIGIILTESCFKVILASQRSYFAARKHHAARTFSAVDQFTRPGTPYFRKISAHRTVRDQATFQTTSVPKSSCCSVFIPYNR